MTNEQLALQIQAGETSLYTPLWEQTEKLIVKLARYYYNGHKLPASFDFEDCLQCGFIALVRSVQAYKPDKGYKLTSYLWNYLRNVIAEELRIHNGKPLYKTCSYNVPVDDCGEIEMLDIIEDEEAGESFNRVELSDAQRIVREAIERLPEDQRNIIILLYYKELTIKQTATYLCITDGQVVELKKKAVRYLRKDRRLMELHRDYCLHYSHMETPVDFYFSDAYRKATEIIKTRQQSGEYFSYGRIKSVMYLAEQAFVTAKHKKLFS